MLENRTHLKSGRYPWCAYMCVCVCILCVCVCVCVVCVNEREICCSSWPHMYNANKLCCHTSLCETVCVDVSILHFWYKCMWKSWLHWHGQTEWITVTYNFYGWFWSIVGHSKTTLMTDIGSKLCFQQKPAHFHNNVHCQSSSCAWWWLLGLQSYMVLMATATETLVHSFAVLYTGTTTAYCYTLFPPWAVTQSDNTGNSYWNLCAVLQYDTATAYQYSLLFPWAVVESDKSKKTKLLFVSNEVMLTKPFDFVKIPREKSDLL